MMTNCSLPWKPKHTVPLAVSGVTGGDVGSSICWKLSHLRSDHLQTTAPNDSVDLLTFPSSAKSTLSTNSDLVAKQ